MISYIVRRFRLIKSYFVWKAAFAMLPRKRFNRAFYRYVRGSLSRIIQDAK
jgi:hypothetical protein